MAVNLDAVKYNQAVLTANDESNAIDISNFIAEFDYFEDILSPAITAKARIVNTAGLYNGLPIRSGERFDVEIANLMGTLSRKDDNPLYVTGVTGYMARESSESFTLNLSSLEAINNETTRCTKKYDRSLSISSTVEKILTEVLGTDRIGEIEPTKNNYGFYGNLKKPFSVLTWLGPKAVPASAGPAGVSGSGETGKSKGTSGYFFYENQDGFNFRSIESMVSKTTQAIGGNDKDIQTLTYTSSIDGGADPENTNKIIHHVLSQNTDLLKNLRIGLYGNDTYFFDPYKMSLDKYEYTLSQELGNKLGENDNFGLPEFFAEVPSRILVRSSDRGMFNDSIDLTSGRDNADMARSFSRYNLLFTQALNINVPLNASLRAGDIVKVILPNVASNTNTRVEIDEEASGYYLIKNLRHHFEKGKATTSMTVIRDSYGL